MIINIDKNRIDGPSYDLFKNVKCDLPILLLSRIEDLEFNEDILSLTGKEYICADFIENGWDWDMNETLIVGVNTEKFNFLIGEGWKRLHEFMAVNKPVLYMKRELLEKDASDEIIPIGYPCWLPAEPLQTKEDFDSRIFQTIFAWGLSHEYRKTMHANIWMYSGNHGYSVCDNVYLISQFLQNEPNNKKWLTLNIPWYSRLPMNEFIKINGLAKISVSLAGAGRICFRHSESPVNSVMLMWNDKIKWSIPWEHNVNCIKCNEGEEIKAIISALNNPNLYEIYKSGIELVDKYRLERYCKEYIEPIINKCV